VKAALDCGHLQSKRNLGFLRLITGYKNKKPCYFCVEAERDKEQMRTEGRINLYLVDPHLTDRWGEMKLKNWSGSLVINARGIRKDRPKAGTRYDVWFTFEGNLWHGVSYSEDKTCYCQQLKRK